MQENFRPKDRTNEFSEMDIEKNKVVCALSYLGILFFLPLVACPDSMYGRFHANQALLLFIAETVMSAIAVLTGFMPLFVRWSGNIITGIVGLLFGIAALLELIYTLQGKAMEIPVLGTIKIIK